MSDAPKVTLDHIEAAIENESYIFPDSTTLTLCVLHLKNGIDVVGTSACVSSENFDAGIGKKLAREAAIDQCWPMFGFYLASVMTGWTMDS